MKINSKSFVQKFLSNIARTRCKLATVTLLLASSAIVHAQDATGDAYANSGVSDLQASVGLVTIDWPMYLGAEETETVALPYFDVLYKQRYFINDDYGIGFYFRNNDKVKFGAGIAYLLGREESESDRLQGLGDVEPGATLNIFTEYTNANRSFSANLSTQVSGENTGFVVELNAGINRVFANRYVVDTSVYLDLASAEFMESYFGVTGAQSAASGLPVYEISDGLKSAGVGLGFAYLYSADWNLIGGIEFDRLLGDAADSPTAFDENQVTVAVGAVYTF